MGLEPRPTDDRAESSLKVTVANLVPALVVSSLLTRSPLETSSSPQAELLTFPHFYQAYFTSLLSHMWHSQQKMAIYPWPLL